MFVLTRSPKGGRALNHVWAGIRAFSNVLIEPARKPEEKDDFLVWKIGYCAESIQKGDELFIKKSDAKKLYEVLKFWA